MNKQKQIWHDEHASLATLSSMEPTKPSSFVKAFIYFLKQKKVNLQGKAIDIGSGKGRNAIYLAKEGLEVYAMDYIDLAINYSKKQAKLEHVADKISFYTHGIDTTWPFPNDYFDFAIDCFSSIDIETKSGREIYKQELMRTLKPKGYALIVAVSANDELEKEMMRTHPGDEPNSTFWPENGKFQKNYDEHEIRNFYKEFKIVSLKEPSKSAYKLGKKYTATNFWIVLQKS